MTLKKNHLISIICVAALLVSCTKEDRKADLLTQETAIDKYISALKCDTVYYQNGVVRAVMDQGQSTDTLAVGDSVSFYYAGFIFNNGKGQIFHTNYAQIAQEYDWPISEEEDTLLTGIMGRDQFIKGLEYGMIGMRVKEHAYIVFNSDYGFGNTSVGQVPKMSPLFFEVWMEKMHKN